MKAFNNIYAQHLFELGKPAGTAGRIALPVAGDDAEAQQERSPAWRATAKSPGSFTAPA